MTIQEYGNGINIATVMLMPIEMTIHIML